MQTSEEVVAWLDLADYARESSDTAQDQPAKRAMLRVAEFCETLAFRHPDGYARSPGNGQRWPLLVPDFAAPLREMTSDAARRFCEQGQTVTKTMSEWNAEVSQFVGHRVERIGEAVGRMTKCQSLPEVFAVQTRWVQEAADDYLKEMSKLMEVNSKLMGSLLGRDY